MRLILISLIAAISASASYIGVTGQTNITVVEGAALDYVADYRSLGASVGQYGQPFAPTQLNWLLASPDPASLPTAIELWLIANGSVLAATSANVHVEPARVTSGSFEWSGMALMGVVNLTPAQAALYANSTVTHRFLMKQGSLTTDLRGLGGIAAGLRQEWDGMAVGTGGTNARVYLFEPEVAAGGISNPEPGTWLLVAAGIAAIVLKRRSFAL